MNGTRIEVGLVDARNQLGNLVHDVTVNGVTVYLTNRGRSVAAIVPLGAAEIANRARAGEHRAEFRKLLDASSLGTPTAKSRIARTRREQQMLPDRWVHLSEPDLRRLLGLYRECRDRGDRHDLAVNLVLTEVDFEPAKGERE